MNIIWVSGPKKIGVYEARFIGLLSNTLLLRRYWGHHSEPCTSLSCLRSPDLEMRNLFLCPDLLPNRLIFGHRPFDASSAIELPCGMS